MRTSLATLAVVLLALFVGCTDDSPSPSPAFRNACAEMRTALCTAELLSFEAKQQHSDAFGRSQSWRLVTPLSWNSYTDHVVSRLSSRMTVIKRSDSVLLMRQTLPSDSLILEVTLLETDSDKTVAQAVFRAHAR